MQCMKEESKITEIDAQIYIDVTLNPINENDKCNKLHFNLVSKNFRFSIENLQNRKKKNKFIVDMI